MKIPRWITLLLFLSLLFTSLDSFAQHPGFDSPDKVPLGGLVREDIFNSPLGPIHLRWTREVEKKFGRNPLRATMDAATAVSRVLRLGSMPSSLQNLSVNWTIAFMDSIPVDAKFPKVLFDRCHPGWMLPPAYVYIVGERIYAGCSDKQKDQEVADELLSKVVVHELAHVVEFHYFGAERWGDPGRKEGFARWIELLASKNSSLIGEDFIKERLFSDADRSFQGRMGSSFMFDGSGESYARMASYFAWIENRYGIAEIFRVYEDIKKDNKLFLEAVKRRFRFSHERLDREVHAFVKTQLR